MLICCVEMTLCGCVPHGSPRQVSSVETLKELLSGTDFPSVWINYLSPDGQWLIQNYMFDRTQLVSTDAAHRVIQSAFDDQTGVFQDGITWAPDSSKFATTGMSQSGKCRSDRVIVYTIQEDDSLERSIFSIPDGVESCLSVVWSPDSIQMLVTAGETIYQLDNELNIISSIDMPDNLHNLTWSEDGIYLIWNDEGIPLVGTPPSKTEIMKLELLESGLQRTTVFEYPRWLGRVGPVGDGKKILFYTQTHYGDENPALYFWIYDCDAKTIAEGPSLPFGNSISYSISPDTPLVGILGNSGSEEEDHFYLYNWETEELTDKGKANVLTGWRQNLGGFLIMIKDEEGYKLKVVIPE